ncbi:MAG TPA: hypothetical protein VNL18_12085, partial [Gemmatimonadales bacterium]|nr:hypothetical protein [Gemmatimonadales bacterium]
MTTRTQKPGAGTTATLHPVEARLGAPEYYRIWCSAEQLPLNQYHSIEFCGWLIGWDDAALDPPLEAAPFRRAGSPATRVEVEIF